MKQIIQMMFLILTLVFGGTIATSHAQIVKIQDAAFANYLFQNYPSACPQKGELNVATANTILGTMDFSNQNITSIDELIYFKSIKNVIGINNKITKLPSLVGFKNITSLNLSRNKINVAPDFSSLTTLTAFNLSNNLLQEFPIIGSLPNLKYISISNNLITALPSFNQLPALDSVGLQRNLLTVNAITPLATRPNYETIFYPFSQNELSKDITINMYVGEELSITLPDEIGGSGVRFRWFANNVVNNTVGEDSPTFTIKNVVKGKNIYESALYAKDIPKWSNHMLYSGEYTVNVFDCPIVNDMAYTLGFDCKTGSNITFSLISQTGSIYGDFVFNLINKDTKTVTPVSIGKPSTLTPGEYVLQQTNNNGCTFLFDSPIVVPSWPKISDAQYETSSDCNTDYLKINTLDFGIPLSTPEYKLKNVENNTETRIDLGKDYAVKPGTYLLTVKQDDFCFDSYPNIVEIPTKTPCACISNVSIDLKDEVNCKNSQLSFTETNAPANYNYSVVATNTITSTTYTILPHSETSLPFGEYNISITDGTCSQAVKDRLKLKLPNNCNVVLYGKNISNAMSEHYVDGIGSAQLINEHGRIIYKQTLPFNMSIYDLQGMELPVGMYVLLFDDGSHYSISIIK